MKPGNIKSRLAIFLIAAIASGCHSSSEKTASIATDTTKADINKIISIARIEPEKGLLNIYSNANGKIQAIKVEENNPVPAGGLLIELERNTEAAQLNQEESKISAQNSAIAVAAANAASLNAELQKAKEDVELNEKLFAAKAVAGQTLTDSKAKYKKMAFDLEKLNAEVNQAKNKIKELNANIAYSKAVLNDGLIKAPFSGKVLQLDVHNGDYVTSGQKLGMFAPDGSLCAVAEVDELFAGKVKLGMKADIISQGSGQKTGSGTIIFIADFLKRKSLFADENTVEDRRVKTVKVRLDDGSSAVINDRVDCIIYLK